MNESTSERHARDWLEGLGYAVERLEEGSDNKTCDYRASQNAETVLVEVKSKDDSKYFKEFRTEMKSSGTSESITPLSYHNATSRVLRRATKQLAATAGDSHSLRIVWFSSYGHDSPYVLEMAERTLYGFRNVRPLGDNHELLDERRAYFFEHAEFYRCRELDGVILYGTPGMALCLNPFSSRCDELRASTLAETLKGALRDPMREEADGVALVADEEVTRGDEGTVHAHLREKYGLPGLSVMVDVGYRGGLRLDTPDDDGA